MIEAMGNIGDFVGGIAVIVTLIYLAMQIRQNTRSALASTELQVGRMSVDLNALIAGNPELARIYRLGLVGSEELTPDESIQWLSLLAVIFYSHEALYRQYERGLLEETSWRAVEEGLDRYLSGAAVANWWRNRAATFSSSFSALVDARIAALEAKSPPSA